METLEISDSPARAADGDGSPSPERGRLQNDPAPRRAQHGLMGVIALFIAFSGIVLTHKPAIPQDISHLCDFYSYYAALTHAREAGVSPYQPWTGNPEATPGSALREGAIERWGRIPYQFIYPPTGIPILKPFSWIRNLRVSELIWQTLSLIALAGILVMMLGGAGGRRAMLAPALALLVSAPLLESFHVGQMSVWVTLLIGLYFLGVERGRPFWGGAALGLAAAIKIYPLFWAPLILLRRKGLGPAILGFLAGGGCLVALSLVTESPALWKQYAREVFLPIAHKPPAGTVSLNAFASPSRDELSTPGLAFSSALFYVVYLPATALLAVIPARTRPQRRRAALFYGTAILLSMPLTWEHYLTIFIAGLVLESRVWMAKARKFPCTAAVLVFAYAIIGARWLILIAADRPTEWSLQPARLGMPWVFIGIGIAVAAWALGRFASGIWMSESGANHSRRPLDFAAAGIVLLGAAPAVGLALTAPDWKCSQLGLTFALTLPMTLWIDRKSISRKISKPLAA